MKSKAKIIFGTVFLIGLQLGSMTGCVGGYVATGGEGYYEGDGPWYHDTVIVGGGWYGGRGDRGYVHPGGDRRDHGDHGDHGDRGGRGGERH